MRLSTTGILLCSLIVQVGCAEIAASEQRSIESNPSWTAPQAPFRMPESERKNVADNPSWTAPQKPFRIYGNT